MKPYYQDDAVTIYHGAAQSVLGAIDPDVGILLTDPPYGIAYKTNAPRLDGNARAIFGDEDQWARDFILEWWDGMGPSLPALLFASPRRDEPLGVRARLVWDQDGALGMGDLSLPWKPSWSLIYVLGGPWAGTRDCGSVLRCPPVQSLNRFHPHQKPVPLLGSLLDKCIPGTVLDPFMGSGSTLVAAKQRGRRAVGVEIDEAYCEIAARRLSQEVLAL